MRITARPVNKERERRFSHSPSSFHKMQKETEENKENQENVITTNNSTVTLTNEDWLAEGERFYIQFDD